MYFNHLQNIPMVDDSSSPNRLPVQLLTVEEGYEGQRLDNFLLARLHGLPKTRLYRLLRKGEIRVNKGRIRQDYRVQIGDVVRVPPLVLAERRAPGQASDRLVTRLEDSILYEDDAVMVINKPSGLAVHGGSGINLGLIEALRQARPQDRQLELVHRLDRETSGCLMIARKRSALRSLHAALREGHVDKTYTALVLGKWPRGLREVRAPLLKNHLQSGERMVKVDEEGKRSHTRFEVTRSNSRVSLMKVSPVTGRTHQIRVHARHAGHPLVGDDKYGSDEANKEFRKMGCKRLFLHASRLRFPLLDGKIIEVEAPLPEDLQTTLLNVFE
ncbi:MAG: 23S rRNA pseudouridine(955/2504/2580) synthase RluC [Pseudomonadales bacterium]